MSLKILCAFVLLGFIVEATARFHLEPNMEYYLLDYNNNSLTITDRLVNTHIITSPFKGLTEQKWLFKMSGDMRPKDNRYVIRPSSAPDKLTMDSDKTNDRWFAKLFNWRNSRLWLMREIGNSQIEIINNKENLCLETEGLGEKVGLGNCGVGETTWWTVVPVEDSSKLLATSTDGATAEQGSGATSTFTSVASTAEAPPTASAEE